MIIITSQRTPTTITWGFCAPLLRDSVNASFLSRQLRTGDADMQSADGPDGGEGVYD